MNITVFGGALPKPGEPAYEEAFQLGALLASRGHCVLTGGYIGTMEAVSRGAREAGAHVVGVTCQEIESWRAVKPNAWVIEERRFETLRDRLAALIDGCDAAIALPGGAGTLAEVSLMWNQMIIQAIPPRPLVLLGRGWRETFSAFYQFHAGYVLERDRVWLRFADTLEEAVAEVSRPAE